MADNPQFVLPNGVVTMSDVGRLMREAESVDNFLNQAAVRQPGTQVQLPKTSNVFDDLVSTSKLNLLQESDRKILSDYLHTVRTHAPILHIGFNTDPSPIFQQRLITWLRQQMNPNIILQIGLQPNIGAGCIVRTNNKVFDFSLRQKFSDQRMLLISKLRGKSTSSDSESGVIPEAANSQPGQVSQESAGST